MAKFDFGINSEAAASEELGDAFYTGPKPPVDVYRFRVKSVKLKKNKNDDYMLDGLFEITEPEGSDKAKYNGYACWPKLNITDVGAKWLNNFFDAIGVSKAGKKAFWEGNLQTDKEKPPNVIKIGTVKLEGQYVLGATRDNEYNGNTSLQIASYMPDGDSSDYSEEPDPEEEEAAGLDDPEEETGEEEPETEEEPEASEDGEEGDDEQYTEEDLQSLAPADLKGILDEWGVEYAPKATKATLVKTILAQYETEEEPEAEEEASEEGEEPLTEDELNEMDPADLKEFIKEKGWTMPKPPVKSKLVKAILDGQAAPPF